MQGEKDVSQRQQLSLPSPAPSTASKARHLSLLFPLGKEDELNSCQGNTILNQKKKKKSQNLIWAKQQSLPFYRSLLTCFLKYLMGLHP